MTTRREALIRASIDHWARLAENEPLDQGGFEEEGPIVYDCPLCSEYLCDECVECPITNVTKAPRCGGTPYEHAFNTWQTRENAPKACEDACYAELQFLLSLLPRGHQ